MPNTFFISDLHLGHKNSIGFMRRDGSPLRPFANIDEADETIIANINSKVSPKDKLYIVGDATMPKSAIHKLARINGSKRLILGNHDHRVSLYDDIMDKVAAYAEFDGTIISHVPVHTSQVDHRWRANIHGHTHDHHVLINDTKRDVRYYNVSIDCYAHGEPGDYDYHSGMNFFPKSWDEIRKELYL